MSQHVQVFPLEVEYSRDVEEHMGIILLMTQLIVAEHKGRNPLWRNIIIGLIVGALIGASGALKWITGDMMIGALIGAVLAGCFGFWAYMAFMIKVQKAYRDRAAPDVHVRVVLDENGIQSFFGDSILRSRWSLIHGVDLAHNCVIVQDEFFGHYIPARALPTGLTLEMIASAVEDARKTQPAEQL